MKRRQFRNTVNWYCIVIRGVCTGLSVRLLFSQWALAGFPTYMALKVGLRRIQGRSWGSSGYRDL